MEGAQVNSLMHVSACTYCHQLAINGVASIPGTQSRDSWDCAHVWESIGRVDARVLVHVGLSTLMRSSMGQHELDTAHILQEWLSATGTHRRTEWPVAFMHDYGVSDTGLCAARIVAAWMSGRSSGSDAVRWRAAAALMRRRLA